MMLLLKRHLLAYLDLSVQMCTLCQENASTVTAPDKKPAQSNSFEVPSLIGWSQAMLLISRATIPISTYTMATTSALQHEKIVLCFKKGKEDATAQHLYQLFGLQSTQNVAKILFHGLCLLLLSRNKGALGSSAICEVSACGATACPTAMLSCCSSLLTER